MYSLFHVLLHRCNLSIFFVFEIIAILSVLLQPTYKTEIEVVIMLMQTTIINLQKLSFKVILTTTGMIEATIVVSREIISTFVTKVVIES